MTFYSKKTAGDSSSGSIQRQADDYAARLLSGDVGERFIAECERWKAQSEAHVAAFEQAMETMASLDGLDEDMDLIAIADQAIAASTGVDSPSVEQHAHGDSNQSNIERRRQSLTGFAVAASIMLMLGIFIGRFYDNAVQHQPPSMAQFSTNVGEQRRIELSDKSVITLNTASTILVKYSGETRNVSLVRGEAYFDVSKDPLRPFIIDLGDRSITVIGTQFNVLREAKNLTVAVMEGVIALSDKNLSSAALRRHADAVKEKITVSPLPNSFHLEAGALLKLADNSEPELSVIPVESMSQYSDWTTGTVRFEDRTFAELVQEINRYTEREIIIEDEELKDLKVNAVVNVNDVETILTGLQYSLPIRVSSDNQKIIITHREK